MGQGPRCQLKQNYRHFETVTSFPTMAMSKAIILSLCMFMLFGLLTSYTDAKEVGYGAIGNGNPIPCSKKGASQKNCQAGAPANPWNRGCNKITECRHGPPHG